MKTTEAFDDNAKDEVANMTTNHRRVDTLEADGLEVAEDGQAGESSVDYDVAGETDVVAGDDVKPAPASRNRRVDWARVGAFGFLPSLALVLAAGAGYLKWAETTNREAQTARIESVQVARDSTVALLSYTPADVRKQLVEARDLLTGQFRDAYTGLTNDVVIPGAVQQQITTVATVPAASSVSATAEHAVVLVFVNQSTTVGRGARTDLTSSIRMTLDKIDGRWLVSQFDPV